MTRAFENVGTYTLPFATVGATNFAKRPNPSRTAFVSLFQTSLDKLPASKTCRVPWIWLVVVSPVVNHTSPLPLCPPFADAASPTKSELEIENCDELVELTVPLTMGKALTAL